MNPALPVYWKNTKPPMKADFEKQPVTVCFLIRIHGG